MPLNEIAISLDRRDACQRRRPRSPTTDDALDATTSADVVPRPRDLLGEFNTHPGLRALAADDRPLHGPREGRTIPGGSA